MSMLVLVLSAVSVAATAALVSSCLRLNSATAFLLAMYVIATAELIGAGLLLSTGKWLERVPLVTAFVGLLVLVTAAWFALGRPAPDLRGLYGSVRSALQDRVVVVLALLAIVAHVYLLAGALTVPQSSPDTLLYHLPRAALWSQQHGVGYVSAAPDERIDAPPPGAEIQIAEAMSLSGGDRFAPLVQLAALAAAALGIVGIARRFGLSRSEAAFGALLFYTFTLVALQTPTALNDLAVAAPLVACAYFAMGSSRVELGLASLALALALTTKVTAVLALPILGAFLLAWHPRQRWSSLAVFGLAGVCGGSVWYLLNLAETGAPDGGLSEAFPQSADRALEPTLRRVGLLYRDLLEWSGGESATWLWSPVPGVVVGVLALALGVVLLAGRRRGATVAFVLAATAVALPMIVIWFGVAHRAVLRALDVVGLDESTAGERLPAQLYEGPMHSSYGVAFSVLLISVTVLAIALVARRELPVAALIAVASPLGFLLLFALVVEHDPMRMRFAAFPVALAASVFAVALRVRLLAWTAVLLTAGTLSVSLVYFAPRPSGLAVLAENRSTERNARWFVQGESGQWSADSEAFRFLEEKVPADATLAVRVARNTYLYPLWNGGLGRAIVFDPAVGATPSAADWLVVGPGQDVDSASLRSAGWHRVLSTRVGWRIYRR